jgi:hypothetical protein
MDIGPAKPKPQHPGQQPLHPRPALPKQHQPMNDFSPRPAHAPVHKPPAHDFSPRPYATPRPAPSNHTGRQQNKEDDYVTLNAQAAVQKHQKEKRRPGKFKTILGLTVFLLVAVGVFLFIANKPNDPKDAKAKKTAVPLVPPEFTVYYPKSLPSGLSVSKSAVTYSKDSFTFIVKQGGQNQFFVYERPAANDPDFGNLKTSLAAPKNIALTLGPGISGGLNTGTITAVKTDRNTSIIINSLNTNNDAAAKDIITAMQVTNDLDSLTQSNY